MGSPSIVHLLERPRVPASAFNIKHGIRNVFICPRIFALVDLHLQLSLVQATSLRRHRRRENNSDCHFGHSKSQITENIAQRKSVGVIFDLVHGRHRFDLSYFMSTGRIRRPEDWIGGEVETIHFHRSPSLMGQVRPCFEDNQNSGSHLTPSLATEY
ncbi:hypothetical protein SCHPADRAFT_472974 [Schizopora paradoxa]|uniref:Uncharacterized protein n=1 Tax=Schizopora paradoxa TaxID=27342 RepID=A0A0H2RHR6_9AGAM|nr:hypothetical protein SCHPADRAFT_472974 [Schizopora paradoxa]